MATLDVGIYFGGSSMSVACFKDNSPSIIVNEAGDRTTPSVISITDHETLVGTHAKQNMIRNSKNTLALMKHFICQSPSAELTKKLDCDLKETGDGEVVFSIEKGGKATEMKLNEAIQALLAYLLELSKSSQGVKECNAVLAVPKYFTEQQTNYLMTCAQKVGFNVHRMITNPMGACLAYNLEEDNSTDSLVLVYQMGGNDIEVSLVQLTNGLYRYVDTVKLENVGGDIFTDIVVDILCEEFQRKHKSNPKGNKRSMFKLKANAEELKHILSTMERAHCSIDALFEGIDFDYYLTRQRFENASSKCYQQVLQPIDDLLRANALTEAQVDQVILCGAATKMVKIQALVREKFAGARLLCNQSPDEIVALGCAKQCGLISNSKIRSVSSQDHIFKCLPKPIFLQIGDSPNRQQVFKAMTPIPLKKSISLELDLQKPYLVIFETEEKFIAKVDLAKFTTKEVTVLFQVKMDETFEVSAKETATGETISVFLNAQNASEE